MCNLIFKVSTGTPHDHPQPSRGFLLIGELLTMALHGSISVHTLSVSCASAIALPFAELRASSFFTWFSLLSVTLRLCTLGPHRSCAFSVSRKQTRTSRMYVVHFVSMRGLQAPSVRLSGHASCFALRLCHLLHLPSSDLAESGCGSLGLATLGLPASCWLQRPSTLVAEVPSVCGQGHGRWVRSNFTTRGTSLGL